MWVKYILSLGIIFKRRWTNLWYLVLDANLIRTFAFTYKERLANNSEQLVKLTWCFRQNLPTSLPNIKAVVCYFPVFPWETLGRKKSLEIWLATCDIFVFSNLFSEKKINKINLPAFSLGFTNYLVFWVSKTRTEINLFKIT